MADTGNGLIQEQRRRSQGRDGVGPAGAIALGDSRNPRLEGCEFGTSLHGSRGGGRKHMDQLSNQVEHSFLPDQPTANNGPASSESDPTSHPPSAPKRLNPKFVEWLQGLPEGWTSAAPINSEALETWLSQCRAQLRSLCC